MTNIQTNELAQTLHQTRLRAQEIEPLTKSFGDFPLATAYEIQKKGIQLRLKDGEKILGYKMGLTSKAKMEQMGLHQPIYGVLTDSMKVENGAVFSLQGKIHPKAEPEIYFITNKDISSPLEMKDAFNYCSHIGVAIEILDSRYTGFKYFTLPDVVADNSSSAFFVLGDCLPVDKVKNLETLKITISDGLQTSYEALASAILGHPMLSLCELTQLMTPQGITIPKGSIILAGAATAAIPLEQDTLITARLQDVGQATFVVG